MRAFGRKWGPAITRAAALTTLVVATACADRSPAVTGSPPADRLHDAVNDPRIGRDLPAHVRPAGTEHNRLTIAVLRTLRAERPRFDDVAVRCAAIVRSLDAEVAGTARAAGAPDAVRQLRAFVRMGIASAPGCVGVVIPAPLPAVAGDGAVTDSIDADALLTDASVEAVTRLEVRLAAARSSAEIQAALDAAAAEARAMRAADATAVQAAVAQTQASIVLWSPGGVGWEELGTGLASAAPYDVASEDGDDPVETLVQVAGADLAGCVALIRGVRSLRLPVPGWMLAVGCGAAATAGTVYYVYEQVT